MLSRAYVIVALTDHFFESSNYENPVQEYYDDNLMSYIIPGFSMEKVFQIQKNYLETKDSPLPFASSTKFEYYQIGKVVDRLTIEK